MNFFKQQKLALGSITLLALSIVLIFFSRPIVSELALMAVLSQPTLLVYTPVFCVAGYALMGLGVAGFVFIALRSRFTVDTQQIKMQSRKLKFAVVGLAVVLFVTSSFASTPVISAASVATTGYYLSTPLPIADWYIGNYSNGNIFAINGSTWANLMTFPTPAPWATHTSNYTQVWVDVLSNINSGIVWAKDVAFPLTLMSSIPVNVRVVCNYQDQSWQYINSANSLGSPYTVSVGQGINTGYYLAQDSGSRICFTSTNGTTVIQSAFNAGTNIVFHGASFSVDAPLTASGTLTISGDGETATILQQTSATANLLNVASGANVTISNIYLNQSNTVTCGHILYANQAQLNLNTIRFGGIKNVDSYALMINNSYLASLNNLHIDSQGNGIYFGQTTDFNQDPGNTQWADIYMYLHPASGTNSPVSGLRFFATTPRIINDVNIYGLHILGTGNVTGINATRYRDSTIAGMDLEGMTTAVYATGCTDLTFIQPYVYSVTNYWSSDSTNSRIHIIGGVGLVAQVYSKTNNVVDGTWIATGLTSDVSTGACFFDVYGGNYLNATAYYGEPFVKASNATHVQVGFYYEQAGVFYPVTTVEKKLISYELNWYPT